MSLALLFLILWAAMEDEAQSYSPKCIYPICRGEDCLATCPRDFAP